ncbi:hypothetical protein GCM10011403_01910 [Pseudohongiella nitratireducens]|jgi:flagellar FliJ protein|uniref:Flagellar FliJ protein n=1 Tax=Pseudohongiella nitratireducens TaxID=1768907 RepID=A0A917GJ74_9GAMM|nr:flagellar export protein FliJ [Pseudohongiella nitratireducens]MDF1623598.1 flagellar export protein FliJ [Pseudohongiella nitratireducens]GGG48468.1 hypothetical protein GCM10011403_01910 [Pseudohongiella nitratireducens]
MNRVARLKPVLRIAELEVDKAGQMVASASQQLKTEQQKLQQLTSYQQEYGQRMITAGQAGITADQLRMYDRFREQLENALTHQQSRITQCETVLANCKTQWQAKDIRFKSLEKLLVKLEREADVALQKSEQKNHDEFARRSAKRHW